MWFIPPITSINCLLVSIGRSELLLMKTEFEEIQPQELILILIVPKCAFSSITKKLHEDSSFLTWHGLSMLWR